MAACLFWARVLDCEGDQGVAPGLHVNQGLVAVLAGLDLDALDEVAQGLHGFLARMLCALALRESAELGELVVQLSGEARPPPATG